MKICVLTLGCRTNQAESLQLQEQLHALGHDIVTFEQSPDFCIINTCSITHKADSDSRNLIRKAFKKSQVLVTGCFVKNNKEFLERNKIKSYENKDKHLIINNFFTQNQQHSKVLFKSKKRPCVKIQDGCNMSCSYCIVPFVRGKSKSIEPEVIINKIKDYEVSGYNEIVLTGIHIGSYGCDFANRYDLSCLLDDILKQTQNIRIRLSSIEINEISERLLKLLQNKRICNHLHIPLQSGDDNILKIMKRPYTTAFYSERISHIAQTIPQICIGTDIIVGFPHESDDAFNNTLRLVQQLPFAYLHCFSYSKRKGTTSYFMDAQIPDKVKKQRMQILQGLAKNKKDVFLNKFLNKKIDVLIEEEDDDFYYGTSSNFIKAFVIKNKTVKIGELVSCLTINKIQGSLLTKLLN